MAHLSQTPANMSSIGEVCDRVETHYWCHCSVIKGGLRVNSSSVKVGLINFPLFLLEGNAILPMTPKAGCDTVSPNGQELYLLYCLLGWVHSKHTMSPSGRKHPSQIPHKHIQTGPWVFARNRVVSWHLGSQVFGYSHIRKLALNKGHRPSESLFPEFALYSSQNECDKTDSVFYPLSVVSTRVVTFNAFLSFLSLNCYIKEHR